MSIDNAINVISEATITANSNGFKVWIIENNNELKTTQSIEKAINNRIIEIIHPVEQNDNDY